MDSHSEDSQEALRLAQRRLQRLEHTVRVQRIALAASVIVLTIVLLASVLSGQKQFARAIVIDDELSCLVASRDEAEAVRQRIIAAAQGDLPGDAYIEQKWEDVSVPIEGRPVLSVSQAVERLSDLVAVKVEAATIQVEGEKVAALPSPELAQKVLDTLRSRFIGDSDDNIISQKLEPDVSILTAGVCPTKISTDIRDAAQRLVEPRGEPREYTVQAGDSAGKIAADNGMTLAEFHELNPDLKGKTIHPGDKVKVGPAASPITVITVLEQTKEERVDAPVDKQYSPALASGEQRVSAEGKPGRRKVTYRITRHNDTQVSRQVIAQETIDPGEPKRLLIGTGDAD